MTRMNGYYLHKCPLCGQLHKRPRYASISIYVPIDLFIEPRQLIVCKCCGANSKFEDYSIESVISTSKSDISWLYDDKPTFFEKFKKFFSRKRPVKIEYPYLL